MGIYNSAIINADVDTVWGALRDFHDMSWADGVIENVQTIGMKAGTEVGAARVLNGAFHETLLELDDSNRTLRYSIDDGPEALSKDRMSGFRGTVRAVPVTVGEGTFVEWSSAWENESGGVAEFCDPIYKALLGCLQTRYAQ